MACLTPAHLFDAERDAAPFGVSVHPRASRGSGRTR